MKLEDITRLNITEIFETSYDLKWINNSNKHQSSFELNDIEYILHIDEYDAKLSKTCTLLDIGFSYVKDGDENQELTFKNKDTSKILGIVANGLHYKLKTLNYDIIIFGAHYKNGAIDSRMRIYDFLSNKYMKTMGFWLTKFNDNPYGKYNIISKDKLAKDDKFKIDQYLNKNV